jgi:NAD(P)-dependent dehydrogenase (short-subunit alcohol dehydrogenase family)
MVQNILIVGGSGAIGGAFVTHLAARHPQAHMHVMSRRALPDSQARITNHIVDYDDEAALADAIAEASQSAPLDMVIVASGLLHDDTLAPEKSLRDLSAEKFHRLFAANTILPALIAKHAVPQLNKQQPAMFAALSARVGSISDNQLGGWYGYRASKAALNMVIRTTAIETARRNKQAIIVGLHPGTVESNLSAPFRGNVAAEKLFTPAYAAEQMLNVLDTLTSADSGKCFAWDGQEVTP